MSAADEITQLVALLKAREAESVGIENLLSEISGALSDFVAVMEAKPDAAAITQAIVAGLRDLTLPAPTGVLPEAAAPVVNVSVEAPVVQVKAPDLRIPSLPAPAAPAAFKGLTLTVTSRDGNGAIRTVAIKPET